MVKQLVKLMLQFIAGIAGNLLAGWIQNDVWANLFTFERLAWTVVSVALVFLLLALVESDRAHRWNWWWHRFWMVQSIAQDANLSRWGVERHHVERSPVRRSELTLQLNEQTLEPAELRAVIADYLGNVRTEPIQLLITGEPGSGKTSAMEGLAYLLAYRARRRLGFRSLPPVFVRLNNYLEGDLIQYIGEQTRLSIGGSTGKYLKRNIARHLERGEVVLVLDALDEAQRSESQEILTEIAALMQREYHKTSIVLTSRTLDIPLEQLSQLERYTLQPLQDRTVRLFIDEYKPAGEYSADIWDRLEDAGLLEPDGLGRNPFWLRIMVESGVVRVNPAELLKDAVNALFNREWTEKAGAKRRWKRVLPQKYQVSLTLQALSWLAYQLVEEEVNGIGLDEFPRYLEKWLSKQKGADSLSIWDIHGLGQDAQLLAYSMSEVRFRHRLLRDYLSAWAILSFRKLQAKERMIRWIHDPSRWQALFLYAILLDAKKLKRFLDIVLQHKGSPPTVWLASACVFLAGPEQQTIEALRVESKLKGWLLSAKSISDQDLRAAEWAVRQSRGGVINRIPKMLSGGEASLRKNTYKLLSQLSSLPAIEILARYGLAERDPDVAEEAVSALTNAGDPGSLAAIRWLYSHDTAYGAMELLKRTKFPGAARFLLKVPNGEYANLNCASALAECASEAQLIDIIRTSRTAHRQAGARAIYAIYHQRKNEGTISANAVAALLESLANERSETSRAAIAVLSYAAPSDPNLEARIRDTVGSESPRKAKNAIKALGKLDNPSAPTLDLINNSLSCDYLRVEAAEALATYGLASQETLSQLVQFAKVEMEHSRAIILEALASLSSSSPEMIHFVLKELGLSSELTDSDEAKLARQLLRAALRSSDPDLRLYASWTLDHVKPINPETESLLRQCLQDKDRRIRQSAAHSLEGVEDLSKASELALQEALADPEPSVWTAAVKTLTAQGKADSTTLRAILRHFASKEWIVLYLATHAITDIIQEMASDVASEVLISELNNPVENLRLEAAHLLGDFFDDPGVDVEYILLELLQSQDPNIRRQAAVVLGSQKDCSDQAEAMLLQAIFDHSFLVREAAAITLGRLGCRSAESVSVLVDVMRSTWDDRASTAGGAYAVNEVGVVDALNHLSLANFQLVKNAIVQAFADQDTSRLVAEFAALWGNWYFPYVREMLRDASQISAAGKVVRLSGDERYFPTLISLAAEAARKQEDDRLRDTLDVILSMTKLSRDTHLPYLASLLDHPNTQERRTAAVILYGIGAGKAWEVLNEKAGDSDALVGGLAIKVSVTEPHTDTRADINRWFRPRRIALRIGLFLLAWFSIFIALIAIPGAIEQVGSLLYGLESGGIGSLTSAYRQMGFFLALYISAPLLCWSAYSVVSDVVPAARDKLTWRMALVAALVWALVLPLAAMSVGGALNWSADHLGFMRGIAVNSVRMINSMVLVLMVAVSWVALPRFIWPEIVDVMIHQANLRETVLRVSVWVTVFERRALQLLKAVLLLAAIVSIAIPANALANFLLLVLSLLILVMLVA